MTADGAAAAPPVAQTLIPARSRVDVRLAGAACGAWGAALVTLGGSAMAAGLLAGAAGVVAAVALMSAVRTPRVRPAVCRVTAVVALGVMGGAAVTSFGLLTRDGPLRSLAEQHAVVTAELVVSDDPRLVGGPPGHETRAVPAEVTAVSRDAGRTVAGGRVLVLGTDPAWRGVLPGQRLIVQGVVQPPRGGDLTAAVLSARGAPRLVGRPPWHQRAAGALRAGLQRAASGLPPAAGGLLPGLAVGDTSRMDPALTAAFKETGLTHLTAVSGSNLAMVGGLVVVLARRCRAGPRLTALLAGAAMVGLVVLVRPSPSVLRAAVMGLIAVLALGIRRPRAALPALGGAVLLLVLADPALARSPGFALSVLATGGLLLIAPSWRDALRRRGIPGGVAEALAVPAAAQAACAPVIAAISSSVSLTAVPANLLAVPVVAPATITGVLAAVVSPVSPTAAGWLAWLGSWPARWLVEVAERGSRVPGGAVPWPGGVVGGLLLAGLTVAVLVVGRHRAVRVVLAAAAVATVLVALPVRVFAPGWPPSGWALVACDVGQGDALVLHVGPTSAIVVDTGPDPASVDGCLRRLGVTTVPLLVLSHLHADHVGGFAGVRRGRSIGAVIVGPGQEPAAGWALVRREAVAARAAVAVPDVGSSYSAGAVRLSVIGPEKAFHGTRSDPNNDSLVLLAALPGLRILLCGDAENAAQQTLLAAGAVPRVDVLKVAHHGSSFSEPEFLDAVDPAIALVSVGAGNRYGHPNAGVLAHLRSRGARVLRTDEEGDLAVTVHDGAATVAVRGAQNTGRGS
jgi:competence protein ComEC